MHGNAKSVQSPPSPQADRTWNTPEAIARHREMTPEQRLRAAIALSQAALRFAQAPHTRGG